MTIEPYSIDDLAADLQRVMSLAPDEKSLLAQVRPLALRAAQERGAWLRQKMYEADSE